MLTDPVGVGLPDGPLTATPTGNGPETGAGGSVRVIVGDVVPVETTDTLPGAELP